MTMKLFAKANTKKDGSCMLELEQEINEWLAKHPTIKIADRLQSSSGGSWQVSKLFITIWYDETA